MESETSQTMHVSMPRTGSDSDLSIYVSKEYLNSNKKISLKIQVKLHQILISSP